MADKAARFAAIRELSRTLPLMLAKHSLQPKYNPDKVGPDLDQFGLLKDRNVFSQISIDNFDKAQKSGVVVETTVWAALARLVDNMCRVATDDEILKSFKGQRDFFELSNAMEQQRAQGIYGNSGVKHSEVKDMLTRNSPAYKALTMEHGYPGKPKEAAPVA